jgi:signal transduction histidine kinase
MATLTKEVSAPFSCASAATTIKPMSQPTSRRRRAAAWATIGLTIFFATAFCALYLVVGGVLQSSASLSPHAAEVVRQPWWNVVGDFESVGAYVVFGILGALIVVRRDGHPMGWLFCAIGLVGLLRATAAAYAVVTLVIAPGLGPGGILAAWVYNWIWIPDAVLLFVFLPLLFPSGRLPSRIWAGVAWAASATAVLFTLTAALHRGPLWNFGDVVDATNPVGAIEINPDSDVVGDIGFTILLASMIAAGWSLVLKLRRARGEEQRQLRWFVYFGALAVAVWVLQATVHSVLSISIPVVDVGLTLGGPATLAALAASTGLVILRYHLYDIDRLVSRSLAYGSLAIAVTALYLAIVVGIGSLVGSLSSGTPVLPIVATAVVAFAFHPLRERLQRFANRLVYGRPVVPYDVLKSVSRDLAGTVSYEEVLPRLAQAAAEGVGALRGRARVTLANRQTRSAAWPSEAGGGDFLDLIPVVHGGSVIGDVAVAMRPDEPLTGQARALLSDLAVSAGPALSNVRLASELENRLRQVSALAEELRASRERVVAAQDEERRKIERDIHDGAQQQLVMLAAGLGAAWQLCDADPAAAAARLRDLGTQAGNILQGLRDLARGVFPQLLADRGLAVALNDHVTRWCPAARLYADPALYARRFDPAIEVALYFCAREALQNAAKHAPDAQVTVTIRIDGEQLVLVVADDGPGFERSSSGGVGLQNMADRLAALGGTLEIRTALGKGTTVCSRVPFTVGGTLPASAAGAPTAAR